jgi:hypothetical protein
VDKSEALANGCSLEYNPPTLGLWQRHVLARAGIADPMFAK